MTRRPAAACDSALQRWLTTAAFNSSRGALARVPAHIGAGRTETPMRVDPGAGNVAAEAAALGRLIRPGKGCADRVPAV